MMQIKVDDLTSKEIAEFLEQHINEMKAVSPPESKHALDLNGLRKPEITFWTVWNKDALVGCGAIKELDASHAEIKSMRTASEYRNRGAATMLLRHIIEEAKSRNYNKLSLETGSMAFFEPARQLYLKFGFVYCEPFASYK
jgi:putative acetyltransferase